MTGFETMGATQLLAIQGQRQIALAISGAFHHALHAMLRLLSRKA